jgi:UDP-glucose 4-epimerase
MKKILVTGGSGFIGSHLVNLLLKKNYKVAITTKYNSIFENIRLSNVWNKIHIIECDLRNFNSVDLINKYNPDTIFHLAAYNDVGGSFSNFNESLQSNLIATSNLLEGVRKFSQFIYISTSEVYGFQKHVPFEESMRPEPISPYSIGKYAGELYANMFMKFYNRPIKIIRPFNAFGPWQSVKAIIPELILNSLDNKDLNLTTGKQTREFNYVKNIVDAFYCCAKSNKTFNQIINVGVNKEISMLDLANLIVKLSQSKSKINVGNKKPRPTDIVRMKSSNKKISKLNIWEPSYSFVEGLSETIKWYKAHKQNFDKNSTFSQLFKY